ncbi:MAG: hypothetical protein WA830_16480 [Candidatus Sulfotelmatobacter sp.]
MILIDSNVQMHLVGTPGPLKTDAQRLPEKLVSRRERLVTDAQVPQEILHRYVAINRRHDIQPAFDALLNVVDEVLPVDGAVAERAKQIVLGYLRLSARKRRASGGDGATWNGPNPDLRCGIRWVPGDHATVVK